MPIVGGGYTDNDAIRELRDEVKKLNISIAKFSNDSNKYSSKLLYFNRVLIKLTIIMTLVTFLQLVLIFDVNSLSIYEIGIIIFYFLAIFTLFSDFDYMDKGSKR